MLHSSSSFFASYIKTTPIRNCIPIKQRLYYCTHHCKFIDSEIEAMIIVATPQ